MILGLGTAALGRPQYINIKLGGDRFVDLNSFKKKGFQVLEEAYTRGVRYFDTAPGYGLAEQLLIEWLQTKNDTSIKVATKWGYTYMANFDFNAKIHEQKEHSLYKLNDQWQTSKALLPNLSVYQIHSATLETGVLENHEILDRLSELKQEYKIKIGLTTTGDNQVEVINKAVDIEVNGDVLFDVFQSTYNILDQSILKLGLSLSKEGRQFVLKETLANGRLFSNQSYPHYEGLYSYLEKLSAKYHVGIDAIALRFCMQSFPTSFVLSGASSSTQLNENLKANSFTLLEDELSKLSAFEVAPYNYWQERKQLTWN
ncbi:aldo/keto reductase [Seonamhaeicola aphaedonensis]|uniref:Aryl-alcohol dehydrogenase-like predicted oxidoreductase n=1 Tax=Seonamhaeicola aphaedonensis TaxID=1461338 RepID=A0A3D9H8B5_9FLAO|nr:aldo/keto reductase [Seonamhaeicola aphaedonensis]RED45742.1 aryl-alcohol dehydrogenase-like predicted oxidoreductase [Seonamhaeicola aphaedonensis]